MDHRRQSNVQRYARRVVPDQIASTGAVWVSHAILLATQAQPLCSLHGTFVPAEHIRNQRPLPEPLPPQVPLLEKIYQSRLAHFVDVVYTRPQYREKNMFEKTALHVLFPLSWVMLIMALTDAAKDHFRTYGMPEMLIFWDEVWRSCTPYLHRDDLVSKLPIPQVSVLAFGWILLLISLQAVTGLALFFSVTFIARRLPIFAVQ